MTLLGSVQRLARVAPVAKKQFSTSARRLGDHGWNYRTVPHPSTDFLTKAGTGIMVFTWWWIWHGIFTEPAHIFGFWDNYPDTEKWTDAELGIPADDE